MYTLSTTTRDRFYTMSRSTTSSHLLRTPSLLVGLLLSPDGRLMLHLQPLLFLLALYRLVLSDRGLILRLPIVLEDLTSLRNYWVVPGARFGLMVVALQTDPQCISMCILDILSAYRLSIAQLIGNR